MDRNKIAGCVLTATTVDDMTVRGGDTGVNDGVKAEERSPGVAGHAPESLSGASEERCGDGKGGRGLHGGYMRLMISGVERRSAVLEVESIKDDYFSLTCDVCYFHFSSVTSG